MSEAPSQVVREAVHQGGARPRPDLRVVPDDVPAVPRVAPSRTRTAVVLVAVVAVLGVVGGTGFVLGAAGVGVGLLTDAATVAVGLVVLSLLGALMARSGVHCPGCTGWLR